MKEVVVVQILTKKTYLPQEKPLMIGMVTKIPSMSKITMLDMKLIYYYCCSYVWDWDFIKFIDLVDRDLDQNIIWVRCAKCIKPTTSAGDILIVTTQPNLQPNLT